MSDSYLRYVPVNPKFQPQPASAASAEALLSGYFPEAEEISAEFLADVEFIDAGSNWSGVFCPLCGEDVEQWWDDAMDEAAESRFENLDVCTPCCKGKTALNHLRYGWPVGFGRFVIEATNPNSKGLDANQLQALSEAIGCEMQEVAAHV